MMVNKMSIATPPIISRRNKSLVSLHESLQKGFLKHNLENRSHAILFPVIEDRGVDSKLASNQEKEQNQRQLVQQLVKQQLLTRPLKKRRIGTDAAKTTQDAETDKDQQETTAAIFKRKALAAKLRAEGVSRKLVLKPSDFARSVFCKNNNSSINIPSFSDPSATAMEIHANHSQVIYDYVRKGDLEGFKKCVLELQEEYYGTTESQELTPFRCSNRFGESLLHLACRRGQTEIVRFLVEELPGASPSQMLNIKDDCHKTPLHDACWTPSPNFELVELILEHAPEQVMMQDVRGNTPFDYVRKEDYALWLKFLWQRRSWVGSKTRTSVRRRQQLNALPSN